MEQKFWNPYVAGIVLGLVLLISFLWVGHGLGASGTAYRVGLTAAHQIAPAHVEANVYMARTLAAGLSPLEHWILFLVLGAFLGGALSSYSAGRFKLQVLKGPRIETKHRLIMALSGGLLMGMAARLARGCTSGQALSGGALLSVHSWIFMFAVFAGGYALAWFVRRQWI